MSPGGAISENGHVREREWKNGGKDIIKAFMNISSNSSFQIGRAYPPNDRHDG